MHILTIPSWYVTEKRPDCGIYFREMALRFLEQGHTAGVVYADTSFINIFDKLRSGNLLKIKILNDAGVQTVRLDSLGWPRRFSFGQLAFAATLDKLFMKYQEQFGKPDVILAHGYHAAYAAAQIKEKHGVSYAYQEHSTLVLEGQIPKPHLQMFLPALAGTTHISSVSSSLAQVMQPHTTKTVHLMPNAVDTSRFQLKNKLQNSVSTFLNVGDLIERRAPDVSLRALAELKKLLPHQELRLEMIGTGHLLPELQALSRQLGVEEQVVFHGLKSNHKVADMLAQKADALLLTSRLETFGVVLIEAMACGLPVVSTRSGGPQDIVTPQTGLLADVDDVQGIAAAMQKMIENYAQYDAQSIRNHAITHYGHEAVTRRWLQIFNQIIS
jgi:L-malate glycosyltransferase